MKAFEFENYLENDNYVFIEADKNCGALALYVANILIETKVRVYYDSNARFDEHSREETAERLSGARKILFIMNKNSSKSLMFRNMVNYTLELKKEIVVIKDGEFNFSQGLEMQLANIPTIVYKQKSIKDDLMQLEIISQDVIGGIAVKRNINRKKQFIFAGLIAVCVVLMVVGAFFVKSRFDYYKSAEYLFKDINNVQYLNISQYGTEAIAALKGKTIEELDLSDGNFTNVDGIQKINVKVINVAHNPNIENLNLIYYCNGLEKIICSQDMLDKVVRLNYGQIDIEVVE